MPDEIFECPECGGPAELLYDGEKGACHIFCANPDCGFEIVEIYRGRCVAVEYETVVDAVAEWNDLAR